MNKPLLGLSIIYAIVAVASYFRYDAIAPLIIMGGVAVVTVVIAWLMNNPPKAWPLGIVWTGLLTILFAYQLVGRMPGHSDAQRDDAWIVYLACAVAALVVMLIVWMKRPRVETRSIA